MILIANIKKTGFLGAIGWELVMFIKEEEIIGLDISEHDMESYAGFQIFTVE